jgi:hypothetical protein
LSFLFRGLVCDGRRGTYFFSEPQEKSFESGTCDFTIAKQSAEKVESQCPAPKGASDFKQLAVSLKRCPDTKREFFSNCKARKEKKGIIAALKALRHPKTSFSAAPKGVIPCALLVAALKRCPDTKPSHGARASRRFTDFEAAGGFEGIR